MHDLAEFPGDLLLIGAGNMGRALLEGWLTLGLDPRKVVAIEPQPSDALAALTEKGLRLNERSLGNKIGVAVLAVKPQTAAEVLPFARNLVQPSTLVLSIMAGKPLQFLAEGLPADTAVVRSMPNTPAAIGRGITVAVANVHVTKEQRTLAHLLLKATGSVEWVEEEALLDAVTAVSGSGPAYVFLLAECLAKAGASAGLPPALAARLARETVAGSGELLHRSPLDPQALRHSVTSPGGTTAAALEILMSPDGLDLLMQRAVAAAAERSRELAS